MARDKWLLDRLLSRAIKVLLHARNARRSREARAAVPGAEGCLIADLSSIDETISLTEEVDKLGTVDGIIYNAGVALWSNRAFLPSIGCPSCLLCTLLRHIS